MVIERNTFVKNNYSTFLVYINHESSIKEIRYATDYL